MNQPSYRDRVRQVWTGLRAAEPAADFRNTEGGSVEQHLDRRLQLHHCANYAAVLSLLGETGRDLSLLELGCGSGALSHAFARAMPPGWRLLATDYSDELVEHARARHSLPNLSFERLDLLDLGPDRLRDVDVVLFLEVIEHLEQQAAAELLARLHSGMKPGGRVVLTTLDRSPFPRAFSGYAPHVVEYTWRSLSEFLGRPENSPFERFRVCRLVSARIAGDAVRAEQRGGYVANRFQRRVLGLAARSPSFDRFRRGLYSGIYRLYARLPRRDRFDFEGHLATMALATDGFEQLDPVSFGLVAVLEKT
ncbi:class I SAM-dependent methyltransferase [candidate division WOR-3 bacterium]|nr:class I SAM-dependent methyltransferase [candidate division WOR-3 bacterium]